ncbi:hypothetical protein ABZ372_50735, partial [Streptomyces sp. NPDC005921]
VREPGDHGVRVVQMVRVVAPADTGGRLAALRETDPADRRAARLLLTDSAAQRLADWRRRRSELVAGQVSRLDEADREALRAALPALRRLAVALHEEAEES